MITIHKEDLTDPALRLYNSRSYESAQLIRPDGTIVHQWAYAQGGSWHYAEMQADGHLLAIIKDRMILELDAESNLVWKRETRAHHDFQRKSDGNTYVVSRRGEVECEALCPDRPLALDYLEEVTPEGEVVWEWKIEDHLEEIGALADLILPVHERFWDWAHVNTLEVLPENPTGERDDRFHAGNLLLCGRHIDAAFVVDRESGSVVWAWGPGELLGPHMPTMLPDGNLLIYDNGNSVSRRIRGFTRILEVEPLTGELVWQYQCPRNFYSPSRGSAERLPNGNCLIAHSDSGRLFEVTPEGQIVWEFLNDNIDEKGRRDPIYRTTHYTREFVRGVAGVGTAD